MLLPRLATAPLLLAPLALLLPGCTDCGGCGTPDAPPPPPSAPYYDLWELEPNDDGCCPDYLGTTYAGESFVIGGHIRDDFYDPFDGFGLTSGEPHDVEFFLEPVAGSADLDLGVWDPYLGQFVLVWESPYATESGRFTVSGMYEDFQLVVMSYSGDAEYRLSVWIDPPTYLHLAAGEANPEKTARPKGLAAYGEALGAPASED
jgi:hypothetical protein